MPEQQPGGNPPRVAAPAVPTHPPMPLATYPLKARPSPTVSRTRVQNTVAVPHIDEQGRKRKRGDREVDTVMSSLRLKRHGEHTVDAVSASTDISTSQRNHARRLDYLQAAWHQDEFIPPNYLDPDVKSVKDLTWHLVNDLYRIAKAFYSADNPLVSMYQHPLPDVRSSPRGLLLRHMASCEQTHITVNITQSALEEIKSPGWPFSQPPASPQPLPAPRKLPQISRPSSPGTLNQQQQLGVSAGHDNRADGAPSRPDTPHPTLAAAVDDGDSMSISDVDDDWQASGLSFGGLHEARTPEQARRQRGSGAKGTEVEDDDGAFQALKHPAAPSSPLPSRLSPTPADGSLLFDDVSSIVCLSGPLCSPLPAEKCGDPTVLETIGVLQNQQEDNRLTSRSIRCILSHLFPSEDMPKDWRYFDPGFPFEGSNKDSGNCALRASKQPNHLLFITQVEGEEHWAVAHLDRRAAIVYYYDSLKSSARYLKVQRLLQPWALTNELADPSLPLSFRQMSSPQQNDAFNCGIFAIETVRRLLLGLDVTTTINPSLCRQDYTSALSSRQGAGNHAEKPPRQNQPPSTTSYVRPAAEPKHQLEHEPQHIEPERNDETQVEMEPDTDVIIQQPDLTLGNETSETMPLRAGRGPELTQTATGIRSSPPRRMWSQSQLHEGSRHIRSLAPQLSEALRQVNVSETLLQMQASDRQLEKRLMDARSALDKLRKDHGGDFLATFRRRLNNMTNVRHQLQQEREIKETSIAALECHKKKHREQSGLLANALPKEFFDSVRVLTQQHINDTTKQLAAINARIIEVALNHTQLQTELDAAVLFQKTAEDVEKERRKLSSGMAWLACIE
ncbi:hypothetical protein LZ30DRAFT_775078 [Colletotrichum cereale]|nr:hypothetical protein LZ30DRAFT_775078 [Colletotrichum cereale]